ncbi:MAG: hypothetical protein CMQ05_03440 [Gammaproteobacteria bacterium]|nr:hypothetical protein [Gammaproteobacteria bacterium]|tara:strand:- start:3796 stop:5058 length:1263 start_codon:yes stop_codon:yes gene_type:complete
MSVDQPIDDHVDPGLWDRFWFLFTTGLTNAIAWLCMLAGIVSLLEASLTVTTDLPAQRLWTATLYWFLFNVAWVYFIVFAVASRVKARIALPLVVTCLWTTTGAIPMNLWMPAQAAFLAPLVQIVVPGAYLLFSRWLHRHWWLPVCRERPITWWYRLLVIPVRVIALILWVLVYDAGLRSIEAVHSASEGFVSVQSDGIYLTDLELISRHGHSVRLVGMMHVGERAAYDRLFRSFAAESTIILEEGVSNQNNPASEESSLELVGDIIMQPPVGHYLIAKRDHQRIPALTMPVPSPSDMPHHIDVLNRSLTLRNVDADVSELSEETARWIENLSAGPKTDSILALVEFLLKLDEALTKEAVWQDILYERNRYVLMHLIDVRDEYHAVIIPWGALHLPQIRHFLIQAGYRQGRIRYHRLIAF